MEKDIVDIIAEKEFIQLTASEKADLHEFCKTEEEYNQLKNVFASVNTISFDTPTPKAETKKDLDALFAQTYPKAGPIWYNSVFAVIIPKEKPFYKQPLLQVAALAVLLFLTVPLFTGNITDQPVQMAKNENIEKEITVESDKVKQIEKVLNSQTEDLIIDSEPSDVTEFKKAELTEVAFTSSSFTRMDESDDRLENVGLALDGNQMSADLEGTPAPMAVSGNVSHSFSNHPDGVFAEEDAFASSEDSSNSGLSFAISASETDDLMDLLTVTF